MTDRRRVNLDERGRGGAEKRRGEAPSLKPTYVEELEARTRAAEQKASDVQSRFEQLRAELAARDGRDAPASEPRGRRARAAREGGVRRGAAARRGQPSARD